MTDCGLDTVLALIGGKWKMLILYHVCHAPRRFGELRRLLSGISEKMLIQDLRQMQESGFFPFSCRQASMGVGGPGRESAALRRNQNTVSAGAIEGRRRLKLFLFDGI
jgi:hypothetical protein